MTRSDVRAGCSIIRIPLGDPRTIADGVGTGLNRRLEGPRLPPGRPSGTMRVHSTQDARLAEKTTSHSLAVVVLAAGKGKRLRSSVPKVLHPVAGRPLLWHVLQTARVARPSKIVIVVGHGADDVREAVSSWGITPKPVFVEQAEQLGTGHAVLEAERAVGRAAEVLVAGGDFDPVRPEDVRALLRTHRRTKSAASVATAEVVEPGGYGRVIREGDRLVAIASRRRHAGRAPRSARARRTGRLPARRPLPRAAARRRDNRQHEVLPQGRLRDPARQGGAGLGRSRSTPAARSARTRAAGLAAARAGRARRHQRRAHGRRRHAAGPGHHLHRRRGADRRRHDDRPRSRTITGDTMIGASGRRSARRRGSRDTRRSATAPRSEFAVVEGARMARNVTRRPVRTDPRPGTILADQRVSSARTSRSRTPTIGEDSKVPHLSYVGRRHRGSSARTSGPRTSPRTGTATTSIAPRSATM